MFNLYLRKSNRKSRRNNKRRQQKGAGGNDGGNLNGQQDHCDCDCSDVLNVEGKEELAGTEVSNGQMGPAVLPAAPGTNEGQQAHETLSVVPYQSTEAAPGGVVSDQEGGSRRNQRKSNRRQQNRKSNRKSNRRQQNRKSNRKSNRRQQNRKSNRKSNKRQ